MTAAEQPPDDRSGSESTVDHPILRPIDGLGKVVIEIIADVRTRLGRWPVYDYVDRTFRAETGVDTLAAIGQLPVADSSRGFQRYGLLFSETGQGWTQPGGRLGLTIAGMYHAHGLQEEMCQLVGVVDILAREEARLAPDPDAAVELDFDLSKMPARLGSFVDRWTPESLAVALLQEPPLSFSFRLDNPTRVHSGRGLREFANVTDPVEYLRRVVRLVGADLRSPDTQALPSALGLAEALGYLDAVWQVRYHSHLLGLVPPATAARLTHPCGSVDEFDSRLSALADLLGAMKVPLEGAAEKQEMARQEKSLARLRRRLTSDMDAETFTRVSDAIHDLQAAVRTRAGGQHFGVTSELASRFGRLGVTYPPQDWGAAWETIRARCATAINTIREGLQAAE